MKSLSKPISCSPSRTDKFPPPLFRFLRTNVGSRSRGRSRSSPMFYNRRRRNSSASSTIIETTSQEPSSPKVTCIGQVRVRRSGKSKTDRGVRRRRRKVLYCWFKKPTLVFVKISTRFCSQKRYLKRAFCKFFGSGYCKKVDANEDSLRVCSNPEKDELFLNRSGNNLGTNRVQEISKRDFLDSPSSPPKNALMLTRCRSAPYRSSSLGGKFWGSPLAEETGDHTEGEKNGVNLEKLENYSSKNVFEDEEESRISDESIKELDNSSSVNSSLQDLKVSSASVGAVHPLLLTRCKSEPARTGERLNQENNFRRQKRLGAVETCLQHSS